MRKRASRAACAALLAGTLTLAACGSGGGSGGGSNATHTSSSVLSLAPGASASGPFSRAYNPFLATSGVDDGETLYPIYEPLYMVNDSTGKQTPWLASSYHWTDDGKSLTLHLRHGVKWSDGKPFSASDVAYTFGLEKKYPALNSGGLPIASATAKNASTVVLGFKSAAYVDLDSILTTQPVPEHLWSKVADPATYPDVNPVGTGPYTLGNFTPQVITLTKNPHYWRGEPAIGTLRYLAFDSVSAMLAALESGQVQWASNKFSGGIKPFLSKDPAHNHITHAAGPVNTIDFNTTVPGLDQVAVRKAISMALNRPTISKVAEQKISPPVVSPTGLNLTTESKDLAPQYRSLRYEVDPAGAKRLLEQAGYKMGSGGVMENAKGTPLSFTVLLPSGSPAFITEEQVIAQELKPIGVDLKVKTVSTAATTADIDQGHYQTTMRPIGSAYDPYATYKEFFDYKDSKPIGQSATVDPGRFDDPAAQRLLAQYAEAPTGSAARTKALDGLEKITVEQVPEIPVFFAADRAAYTDKQFTGWPTASDNYAPALAYDQTVEMVLLNLKPS